MKLTANYPNHQRSKKTKVNIVIREKGINHLLILLLLISLVISLASCNLPQKKTLSGERVGNSNTAVTGTPEPQDSKPASADAGGATLNLQRNATFDYPNGSDIQSEAGAIPLVFSKSIEGDLIVEGEGKTEWKEVTNFPGCSYTSKAEVKINVRGLFTLNDCKFHLTIESEFSQPTTTYQDQNPDTCLGAVKFNQTEISSQVELDPATDRSKETKEGNWWEISTVKLSDLKSEVVQNCFVPEVIERSK